jgi:hypothetical protein
MVISSRGLSMSTVVYEDKILAISAWYFAQYSSKIFIRCWMNSGGGESYMSGICIVARMILPRTMHQLSSLSSPSWVVLLSELHLCHLFMSYDHNGTYRELDSLLCPE